MSTTLLATVEPDHTVKVPKSLPVGEQVMIVRIPSASALLNDVEWKRSFMQAREAIRQAVDAGYPRQQVTDEEIVSLVKEARQSRHN